MGGQRNERNHFRFSARIAHDYTASRTRYYLNRTQLQNKTKQNKILSKNKSTVFVVSVYFLISFNLFSFCVSFYLHYVIHRQFLVNITISDCPLLIFLHFPFECNSMIVY